MKLYQTSLNIVRGRTMSVQDFYNSEISETRSFIDGLVKREEKQHFETPCILGNTDINPDINPDINNPEY